MVRCVSHPIGVDLEFLGFAICHLRLWKWNRWEIAPCLTQAISITYSSSKSRYSINGVFCFCRCHIIYIAVLSYLSVSSVSLSFDSWQFLSTFKTLFWPRSVILTMFVTGSFLRASKPFRWDSFRWRFFPFFSQLAHLRFSKAISSLSYHCKRCSSYTSCSFFKEISLLWDASLDTHGWAMSILFNHFWWRLRLKPVDCGKLFCGLQGLENLQFLPIFHAWCRA